MTPADIERMAVAWIVRHRDDGPDTRPAVYFSAAEAEAHAAQYLPGVATVVALGDVAAARAQALEDAAERCEENAQRWPGSIEKHYVAHECAAAIRALPPSEG